MTRLVFSEAGAASVRWLARGADGVVRPTGEAVTVRTPGGVDVAAGDLVRVFWVPDRGRSATFVAVVPDVEEVALGDLPAVDPATLAGGPPAAVWEAALEVERDARAALEAVLGARIDELAAAPAPVARSVSHVAADVDGRPAFVQGADDFTLAIDTDGRPAVILTAEEAHA